MIAFAAHMNVTKAIKIAIEMYLLSYQYLDHHYAKFTSIRFVNATKHL